MYYTSFINIYCIFVKLSDYIFYKVYMITLYVSYNLKCNYFNTKYKYILITIYLILLLI